MSYASYLCKIEIVKMTSNIEFRILTSSEKEQYRRIRLECLQNYQQNFGSVYENEVASTELKFDKIIAQENSNDFLFGAFDNENLIGICGNIQEKGTKTKHIAEISHVYVKPTCANKGIATNLLKHTI